MFALFFKNVENYNKLDQMTARAQLEGMRGLECEISTNILLDESTFREFLSDFRKNHKWLYPYINDMRIGKDCVWVCPCIIGENHSEKILVFNNGASYPEFIAKC